MTINVAETVISVPLNKLTLSPLNVRKRPARPEQDAELKAAIFARGLQQNLVAIAGDEEGAFAVVAGGRRLKVLQELAAEGSIPEDFSVRCVIVPAEDGAEHSLIENAVRANMHPSEEVTAFRDLILEKDFSRDAVAERYGVTLRVVDQRMKLANVAPVILEAWRDGALTQSQVEAFALSDDPERQRSYFEDSADWALKPESIRKAMLQQALCMGRDRLATFVGREEYEAAGGTVVADLFAENVYLQDAALAQELAQKKLQRLCDEAVASEGWAWGRAQPDFSYRDFEKFQRIHGSPADDPERDALKAKLDAAQARYDARKAEITEQCTNAETGEVDQEAFEQTCEADGELERLSHEIEAANEALQARIDAAPLDYDPAEKALAGIAVSIATDGRPEFKRGLVHPDQLKQLEGLRERARIRERLMAERREQGRGVAAAEEGIGEGESNYPGEGNSGSEAAISEVSPEDEEAGLDADVEAELARQRQAAAERQKQEADHAAEVKGDLSASLVSSLTLERSAGLRAAIAAQPGLALRLVVYQFAMGLCSLPRDHAPVIGVEVRRVSFGGVDDSPAGKAYQEIVERLCEKLPGDSAALFDHVMKAGDRELLSILAVGVAGTIDAHIPGPQGSYRAKKRFADCVAEAAGLDMSRWWRADEAFFARAAKGVMIEALREAAPMIRDLPSDQARELALADLARKPKAELVKITAQALDGAGWLPKPLRTKGINDADAHAAIGDPNDGIPPSTGDEARDDESAENNAAETEETFRIQQQSKAQVDVESAPISELPPWETDEEAREEGFACHVPSQPGGNDVRVAASRLDDESAGNGEQTAIAEAPAAQAPQCGETAEAGTYTKRKAKTERKARAASQRSMEANPGNGKASGRSRSKASNGATRPL